MNMKILKISIVSIGFICLLVACSMLEPENDNHSTSERLLYEPAYGEGLLIRAYTFIPTNGYRFDEVATDDAVTNEKSN